MDIRPNQTLYVNNLNDKIKKNDLKRALYYLFSQYGRMIDIIAMKTMKMRGQAFIIYADISSASSAYKMLQGFHLFQRPMRIQYAKQDSTQVARNKGLSVEALKKKEEEREKRRRKKLAQRLAQQQTPAIPPSAPQMNNEIENLVDQQQEETNNILYLSNLPEETTEAMLSMLFSQFTGFRESRKATGGVAFIEYDTDTQAAAAKSAYEGFKLTPTHCMEIKFAKK